MYQISPKHTSRPLNTSSSNSPVARRRQTPRPVATLPHTEYSYEKSLASHPPTESERLNLALRWYEEVAGSVRSERTRTVRPRHFCYWLICEL